jgi:predicted molibdopterin-dependent oxidoreductase YjgC
MRCLRRDLQIPSNQRSEIMNRDRFLTIDKKAIPIENEQNLLELVRKAGIDLPTFCYHSELSVYGACRLCMVDVEGMGLVPACSTPPTQGMQVSTNTEETRKMRKMIVELLLANHSQSCPTCGKSSSCQLQSLAPVSALPKSGSNSKSEMSRSISPRLLSSGTPTSACSAATVCASVRRSSL